MISTCRRFSCVTMPSAPCRVAPRSPIPSAFTWIREGPYSAGAAPAARVRPRVAGASASAPLQIERLAPILAALDCRRLPTRRLPGAFRHLAQLCSAAHCPVERQTAHMHACSRATARQDAVVCAARECTACWPTTQVLVAERGRRHDTLLSMEDSVGVGRRHHEGAQPDER